MDESASAEAVRQPRPDAAIGGAAGEPRRVHLLGFDFDDLTQSGLVERIGKAVRAKERCWVATLNVNLLCLAHREPGFRTALERAEVRTADGMPIVWMSRLRGRPLAARVTGSDLMIPLAVRAAEEGWRLFLCGGAPGVADQVAAELQRRAPGLKVVGTASPSFSTAAELTERETNAALLAAIHAAAPDVLLAALGSPKQERWIDQHRATGSLEVPVVIGVGASFDFLVGHQSRAPRWMRRAGLEWVHRMATQPFRLAPRYARDALTFARLCFDEILGRHY